ncbi:MAG TPA: hypothetical protein DEP95_03810 [Candidatus Staskawiczbacteria bacterium]|nr:hypothetical protein [Candidatus Staskawiczbacteria bacterium]
MNGGQKKVFCQLIKCFFQIMTNKEQAINKISEILYGYLKIPLSDEFKDTPKRIISAWEEFCSLEPDKIDKEIEKITETVFKTDNGGMIIVSPLTVTALCAHHLFPISYQISFGYIPRKNKNTFIAIGLSKILEVIQLIARKRPHGQENFTKSIVNVFEKALNPQGMGIIVLGVHECIRCRKNNGFKTITTSMQGSFTNLKTRMEFLELLKKNDVGIV